MKNVLTNPTQFASVCRLSSLWDLEVGVRILSISVLQLCAYLRRQGCLEEYETGRKVDVIRQDEYCHPHQAVASHFGWLSPGTGPI